MSVLLPGDAVRAYMCVSLHHPMKLQFNSFFALEGLTPAKVSSSSPLVKAKVADMLQVKFAPARGLLLGLPTAGIQVMHMWKPFQAVLVESLH